MAELLFECFSEEMPARMQAGAAEQLVQKLSTALKDARLEYSTIQSYVCPRHLAVRVSGLPTQQPDVAVERKGPKTNAPEQALQGFLKSTGLSKDQLEIRKVGKDDCYFAITQEKGRAAAEAIKTILEDILTGFHWPKSQRWGAHSIQWVRPLQNLLCLFDSAVIPVQFGHLTANNITYGHRFLSPAAITIHSPEAYVDALMKAHVMVDADERKEMILDALKTSASENNVNLVEDAGLLDEVTGLVEWPTILCGHFSDSFLDLPPEVLVSEMRHHQKYFAAEKPDGSLSNHYFITSNMLTQDAGAKIIHGNGRVLRARLSDGAFYWDQDRKRPLSDWNTDLKGMIFHAKLGSVQAKVERITSLSLLLAVFIPHANLQKVERAAELCKADLVTGMVGEFPDLQGIMGRYYANAQAEDAEVADAIRDHYKPVGANDSVPEQPVAIAISLADKLDSLMGLFAIGEKPTGSKDPFALRRAALGVIRIILSNQLRMPLRVIFNKASAQYSKKIFTESADATVDQLIQFFIDRLQVMLRDQGIRHDIIEAVLADSEEDDLLNIVSKVNALNQFISTDDGSNLLSAYKRASNILSAEEKKDGITYADAPNEGIFELPAENALYAVLEEIRTPVTAALKDERYTDAMAELSKLRHAVDEYFAQVMVNDADPEIRKNRLFTLSRIRTRMDSVAHFAAIEGSKA